MDHKARADQLFGEINHRIGQKRQADLIDQHLLPIALQHQIICRWRVQPDVILKPRAAAALNRHPQGLGLAGDLGNLGQTGKGAGGNARQGRIGGKGQFHDLLCPLG